MIIFVEKKLKPLGNSVESEGKKIRMSFILE